MRRVIKDLLGITHRFEGGVFHNTRCGRIAWTRIGGAEMQIRGRDGHGLGEGVVDCMTCLVGPSRLTARDLVDSPEIEVVLRLVGIDGGFVGPERRIVLERGSCAEEITYEQDAPLGVVIAGVAYLTEDGDELHRTVLEESRRFGGRLGEGDVLHVTVSLR